MLPNFNECWWDSIILDVFLCNWIGIPLWFSLLKSDVIFSLLSDFLVWRFRECFLLEIKYNDNIISKFTGIWAGMKTVKYFDGKTYAWVGLSRQKSILGKVGIFPYFPFHFTYIMYLHDKEGMSLYSFTGHRP